MSVDTLLGTFTMPAETAPQERVWMAFPSGGYTLGDTAAAAEAARTAWAATARAVARFAPVTLLVDPSAETDARRHLGDAVQYAVRPLNDAWMRDMIRSAPHPLVTDDHRAGARHAPGRPALSPRTLRDN